MIYPAWRKSGPWPYEAGIALLLIWAAECFRHFDEAPGYAIGKFWQAVLGPGALEIIQVVCWLLAACLILGLGVVVSIGCRRARYIRVIGMGGSSVLFTALAMSFHATWNYSLGGGAFFFLAWRSLCVARRMGRESFDGG